MKSSSACDASTALNWTDPTHRVRIAENLRSKAEILVEEVHRTKIGSARAALFHDLSRVYSRLAVCDLDAARQVVGRIRMETQRDNLCRLTLEKMADMLEEMCWAADEDMQRHYMVLAQAFGRTIGQEGLTGWFDKGPMGALNRLAGTVAEVDVDKAIAEREAFPELIKMARMIPVHQAVEEEEIESQIFRDGLRLFRRHQGLEKYPFEK